MATIRCPQCGASLPSQARFCGKCGQTLAPLEDAALSTAPSVPDSSSLLPITSQPLGQERVFPKQPPPVPASAISLFLSYSHTDTPFARRLQEDLQAAGFQMWIDRERLLPGTPDWEESLRQGIRSAQAILVVASPTARLSPYVRDELRIAKMYERPIYPIWADGEVWIDSIPYGWGGTQYSDARGDAYATGVRSLIDALIHTLTVSSTPSSTTASTDRGVITFTPRNPFKGLNAFRQEDARDFFGRKQVVDDLVDTIKAAIAPRPQQEQARLVAVLGPSGSGKSSVVQAGLLPQFRQGAVPGSDAWIYLAPLTPGERPLEQLALKLAPHFPQRSMTSIQADLAEETARGLHLFAWQLVKHAWQKVVVVIDQFEELFTLTTNERERQTFINVLFTAASDPKGPVVVLLTLRADFYDRLTAYPHLARLIESHHRLLLPMEIEDLRAVVMGPAALPDVQLSFEGTLAGDLLFEVWNQPGALPLLQFTLDQLFARRNGHQLTLAAYRELGGVRGALTRQAEATYLSLPSDAHRRLARSLFLRLIDPGASEQDTTRRRAARAELALPDPQASKQMQEVADAFVSARLLVTNEVAGVTTIEVSHELLIRVWPLLGDWLREAREDLPIQQAISKDAAEWERHRNTSERLYRGAQLTEAQTWAKRNSPSAQEAAFLRAGSRRRTRVRVSWGTLALVLLLIVGIGGQYLLSTLNTTTVTTLQDSGPGSLRQDIANANSGSTIIFKAGLRGTLKLTADLVITKSLTIRGPGAQNLAITNYSVTVAVGSIVAISGLTFHSHLDNEGNLTLSSSTVSDISAQTGGGIFNTGSLTLITGTVSNNTARGFGGGIYNNTGAVLTVKNSTISHNTAQQQGGGIYNDGTLKITNNSSISDNIVIGVGGGIDDEALGTVTLISSTVSHNTAQSSPTLNGDGGGIENNGTLTLISSTISDNMAQGNAACGCGGFGGGIHNDDGTIALNTSTVSGNTAQGTITNGGGGGGIYTDTGSTTTLTNSTITDNKSAATDNAGAGAGIYNSGGTIIATGSTISYNIAQSTTSAGALGGGILSEGTLMLTNSTISDNIAQAGTSISVGGAILNVAATNASTPTINIITFCTIYGNRGSHGSSLASQDYDPNTFDTVSTFLHLQIEVRNSIIAGNQNDPGQAVYGPLTTEGYNLLQDTSGALLADPNHTHGTDILLPATTPASQFIAPTLDNNGGPTETLKLLPVPGNPAIAVIPLNACHIADPATQKPILTDQRGMPRPGSNKTKCDIGAYESSE